MKINIFDLALEITQKTDGDTVDFINNAMRIRKFLDRNPKFVELLLEGTLTEKDSKYLGDKISALKRRRQK